MIKFCLVLPLPLSLRCRWRKETEVYLNNSANKSESPEIWACSLRSFTLFSPMEKRPSSQRSVLYLREAGRHKGERWIDKCYWYYQNGPHFERFGDLLDFFSQTVRSGVCLKGQWRLIIPSQSPLQGSLMTSILVSTVATTGNLSSIKP